MTSNMDPASDKADLKPPATSESGPSKPAEVVEEYPDPDEDDLDDLDDMLDDFSSVKIDAKKPGDATAQATTPSVPADTAKSEASPAPAAGPTSGYEPKPDESFSEEEFAKQLQSGMADLLGEFEQSPEMQAQFEDIFKQINAAAANVDLDETKGAPAPGAGEATAAQPSASAAGGPAGEASFQDTIKATMERMQNSGDQATAAAASGSDENDFMAEMLKSLSSGDFNAEGSEEDFSKMLMGMMDQLTNKEILYEPMKELHDKFPAWIEQNKGSTPAEDMKRYDEQRTVVAEIVAKFEESTYSDSNTADREYIVDRMQKMQAAGSPPADLVGDMNSAQEAFGGADDQCNPQ